MILTVFSLTVILEFVFFDLLASRDDAHMKRDPYLPPMWLRMRAGLRRVNRLLCLGAVAVLLLKAFGLLPWW